MTGAAPGSGAIRADLERNPRDPFAGNVPAVIAELSGGWPEYDIGYDGWWTASRKDGAGDPLRELSPDELIAAMRSAR